MVELVELSVCLHPLFFTSTIHDVHYEIKPALDDKLELMGYKSDRFHWINSPFLDGLITFKGVAPSFAFNPVDILVKECAA